MTEQYPVHVPELPPEEVRDRLVALVEPFLRVVQPKIYGIENVGGGGVLLVGNHTIYGFLDLPLMMAELWKRERIAVRGLGEHAHYAFPVWRDALAMCGMVRGTRANVRALMRDGQNVLVFPGGAREVNKRKGEKYQLLWKERLGFARLAIEHDYPIVPFAAVGAEEMLDVVVDDTNPVYARFAAAVEQIASWPIQPIVRGIGPTPLPRPERQYFWFGRPIATGGRAPEDVRDEVKAAIEGGIVFLHAERERDPHRGLLPRLRRRVDD